MGGALVFDFLPALGFDLQSLIAGFAGGICVSFSFKKSNPWDIVGSIVVGGLFGNYVVTATDGLVGTLRVVPALHNTSAFFVGVVAMPLCKFWVERFKGSKE